MFVALRALRFHAQSCVAWEAFPRSAWCLLASEKLFGDADGLMEPKPDLGVSARSINARQM
jgi:hypothetical protein